MRNTLALPVSSVFYNLTERSISDAITDNTDKLVLCIKVIELVSAVNTKGRSRSGLSYD